MRLPGGAEVNASRAPNHGPPSGLVTVPEGDLGQEPRRYGVVLVRCPYGPPRRGGSMSAGGRIARGWHYLCAADMSPLGVLGIANRRVRLGPCPSCGAKYHGPTLEELGREAIR